MTNLVMERFMKKYILLLVLALGFPAGSRCLAEMPENSIYVELIDQGVPLSSGDKAKLPVFLMVDGLDQAGQQKVLEEVVAKIKGGPALKQLLDNKTAAPFIRINAAIPNSDSHQIDLYFIAYGSLQTVANGNFWKARIGQQGNGAKLDFLKEKDLKQRGLTVIDTPSVKERWAHAKDVDLLSTVLVAGTAHTMETVGDESVVVAILLDPKFQNDKDFPNEWRKITFNKRNGVKQIGSPNPYDGLGAYAKVTKLASPAGALFVEYHIIYNEPQEWFDGKGVLDTRLREMIQNDVKRFRNDLKTAPAGVQAGAAAPAAGGQPQQPAGPQAAAAPAGSASKK